jgi:hypothetical protein
LEIAVKNLLGLPMASLPIRIIPGLAWITEAHPVLLDVSAIREVFARPNMVSIQFQFGLLGGGLEATYNTTIAVPLEDGIPELASDFLFLGLGHDASSTHCFYA